MKQRIIIDTNLWISYLLAHSFRFLDDLITKDKVVLLYDFILLNEIIEVCQRPKLSKYISKTELAKLIDTFDAYGEFVTVSSAVDVSRDPEDNFLLSLALDGKADFLITGDKDLLSLKKFESTEIITIADFEKI